MTITSLISELKRLVGTPGRDVLNVEVSVEAYDISTEARAEAYGLGGNDTITATASARTRSETGPSWPYEGDATVRAVTHVDGGDGDNSIRVEAHGAAEDNVLLVEARNEIVSGRGRALIDAAAEATAPGAQVYAATNDIVTGWSNDSVTAVARTEGDYPDSGFQTTTRNTISTGSGHDVIFATAEHYHGARRLALNEIDAGTGDDVINARAVTGTTTMWEEGDTGEARNVIQARAGDDHVTAYASGMTATNWISAGAGDDTVYAVADALLWRVIGPATNTVLAGAGDDVVNAIVTVAPGDDGPMWGENDLRGEAGNDTLRAEMNGAGVNRLDGGTGHDTLIAELNLWVTLRGGGGYGENRLSGGAGDDTLLSTVTASLYGNAIVALDGGAGDDVLEAYVDFEALPEEIVGFPTWLAAQQTLHGGAGADTLIAEIRGDATGVSRLYGGDGDDVLSVAGGSGNILDGGAGNDVLYAGDGDDTLIGGAGADTFVFDFAADQGRDVIADFDGSADRLAFRNLADAGAPGLVDDLDDASDFGIEGGDLVATLASGSTIVFAGFGAAGVTSFADLVADPGTQIIAWDALV